MHERDIAEKTLASYNDVFADIVNALLFDGRQVVDPAALGDATPVSMYKADDGLHEQERDVAKYWTESSQAGATVRIALLGMENQTEYDKDMPLRVIGYDGAAYRAQLSQGGRYPVITLVLYFGNRRWDSSRSLHDAVNVPTELEPYVSDYRINVFEIPRLTDEQLGYFKSDFGVVADYFVHRRENPDYRPGNPKAFEHVDELLKLLSVVTQDNRFVETLHWQGEVPKNMCEVLDRVEEKGRREGKIEGRLEGKIEGRLEAVLENIRSLMANMRWTAQQAMSALGISPEEQPKYLAML